MHVYVYIKKFHFLVSRKTQMMRSSCKTVIAPNSLNQLAYCRQRSRAVGEKFRNARKLGPGWISTSLDSAYKWFIYFNIHAIIFELNWKNSNLLFLDVKRNARAGTIDLKSFHLKTKRNAKCGRWNWCGSIIARDYFPHTYSNRNSTIFLQHRQLGNCCAIMELLFAEKARNASRCEALLFSEATGPESFRDSCLRNGALRHAFTFKPRDWLRPFI